MAETAFSRVIVTPRVPEESPFFGQSDMVKSYGRAATGGIWYIPKVWVDADDPEYSGWYSHYQVERSVSCIM